MLNGSLLLRKIENGRALALKGGLYTPALAGGGTVLWLTQYRRMGDIFFVLHDF